MSTEVEQMATEIAILKGQVAKLTTAVEDVAAVKGSIDELIGAWKAAGLMVGLAKWAAGIVTAILGAWIAIVKFRELGH